MAGRPPRARDGDFRYLQGQLVGFGRFPTSLVLSTRVGDPISELWRPIEALQSPDVARERVRLTYSVALSEGQAELMAAFIKQAKNLHRASVETPYETKPLPLYYAYLNLAKAYLTISDFNQVNGRIQHGASHVGGTSFPAEETKAARTGVFTLLARRTGLGHAPPEGSTFPIMDLLALAPETADEYGRAAGKLPSLARIEMGSFLFDDETKEGFIRIDFDRDRVRALGLNTVSLPRRYKPLQQFRHVDDAPANDELYHVVPGGVDRFCYESTKSWTYSRSPREVHRQMCKYVRSKLNLQPLAFGGVEVAFGPLDPSADQLSYEARTFLILHSLSEIVRYRPLALSNYLGGRYGRLIAAFLERASTNAFLCLGGLLVGEDLRLD